MVDEQRNFWMQALQDKRKHIDNAKKYAGPQDTSWWDLFFINQQGIIDNSFSGVWPLQLPFTWTVHHTPSSQSPTRAPNAELDNKETSMWDRGLQKQLKLVGKETRKK